MSGPEIQAEPVREAVRAYAARQPQLVAATAGWVRLVRTLLDDAGIAIPDEQEDEVEKFREFLDQISPEDFGTSNQ